MLISATLFGLAVVDFAALRSGFGGYTSLSVERLDELSYALTGPYGRSVVDLSDLNRLEGLRREYEVFTMPRAVRLASRWLTAGWLWFEQAERDRREAEYHANAGLV